MLHPIGNLPSASTFTDKRGKGWNNTDINKYFTLKKTDDDSDEDSNNKGCAEEVRDKQKGHRQIKTGLYDNIKTVLGSSHHSLDDENNPAYKGGGK